MNALAVTAVAAALGVAGTEAGRAPLPAEPALSLSTPQPGSTAAEGNGTEGLYVSLSDVLFVSPGGDIAAKFAAGTLWGAIRVQGTAWSFDAGTRHHFFEARPVEGSGAFVPRRSMSGSYAQAQREPEPFGPYRYALENALAVSQASIAGTWHNPPTNFGMGMSIEVDARGAFTGTSAGSEIGHCQLSGSVTQLQPGTAKNMFRFRLVAAPAGGAAKDPCQLVTGMVYSGPAAVVLSPAAAAAGAVDPPARNILFLVRTGTGATLSIALREQAAADQAAGTRPRRRIRSKA